MSLEAVGEAIRSRHSNDLIVPECKDGPTWGGTHRRLDYWVLRRSWSKPAMIGYEVKSSRRDFLADNKWQDYLPLCNELWFVADPKHVLPGELPEGVGHLRLAGARLITVRKAVWREIPFPDGLATYVLMCRTAIKGEHREPEDRAAFWREWVKKRDEDRRLGYEVAKALRERYERDVATVSSENKRLLARIERADKIEAALKAKGIEWSEWLTDGELDKQIKASRWDIQHIEHARVVLTNLLNGRTSE